MKPLLLILLTTLCSLFAQAADHNPKAPAEIAPAAARKSFERTFASASEVSWSLSENMYRVAFQVAGQHATAYYSQQGTLVVVTRNIASTQLPVVLLAAIKKDYERQWISELVEVSDESGTRYYATLEDGVHRQILRSEGISGWTRYMKLDK